MLLDQIVANKKREVSELKRRAPRSELEASFDFRLASSRKFRDALKGKNGKIHLICEMKKASPSEGMLKKIYLPRKIAMQFENCGATAISVLTEKLFFQGSINTLPHIKGVVDIPVLRKDFIIDEYQIYESRAKRADAILLIASILSDKLLRRFLKLSKQLGLDALVETHKESEMQRAVDSGADLIGVNNRNLNTLRTNLKKSERLIQKIPHGIVKIVESGIDSRKDIVRYRNLGVDGFLVGTALMKTNDISKKIKELLGK